MVNSKLINTGCSLLDNFSVKEKSLRTIQYGALLVIPMLNNKNTNRRKALESISEHFGEVRVILRLFDDLPMLRSTLSYGWGIHESNKALRVLHLIENASGQLYYPTEHIAWAQDMGLISGRSSWAWKAGLILWFISLFTSIVRCLIRRKELKKQLTSMEDSSKRQSLKRSLLHENMNLLMFTADLLNAMNWLSIRPWGGKPFPSWLVGLLGLTSSLVGMYNLVVRRN